MGDAKLMVSGASGTEPVQHGRYLCGICGRELGVNSGFYVQRDMQCHKNCSGLRSFNTPRAFLCLKCTAGPQTTGEPPLDPDGKVV